MLKAKALTHEPTETPATQADDDVSPVVEAAWIVAGTDNPWT